MIIPMRFICSLIFLLAMLARYSLVYLPCLTHLTTYPLSPTPTPALPTHSRLRISMPSPMALKNFPTQVAEGRSRPPPCRSQDAVLTRSDRTLYIRRGSGTPRCRTGGGLANWRSGDSNKRETRVIADIGDDGDAVQEMVTCVRGLRDA
ncbi:hypothetical protein BU25DRAFT_111382 [Macroventuria anomochaeta]|uniref:Uncharacterized protein n=1 Tax=Macroventuria anomochaeta TaxID=301207 RepID=A0ACB6RXY0_9PLEO|nr:uncharacterized protein BU25DRAFT_111382 [Macroventuria anomochaeta]KAF2625794.1 hypothetical protein BU25DRAFT_111382 [Macroventuria anomochaeta]